MSSLPVNAPPTAPKQNIRMLPIVNAITVAMTVDLFVLPKRAKLGVAEPPEMNEPITAAMPPRRVMLPVDLSKMATNPPPSTVAVTME